jgi:hypothetical protein
MARRPSRPPAQISAATTPTACWLPQSPLSRRYRVRVAERRSRVPIGERVTQAHLDHFCPGGAGLPVTDSGPIGLGPVGDPPLGDPPLGSEASTARSASEPCARCGDPITPAQDARRRVTGAWVHEPARPDPPGP